MAIAEWATNILELSGMAVIVGGVVLSLFIYVRAHYRSGGWAEGYDALRASLGRGILLGLELLVAADIIKTVSANLDRESVAVLAAIVLIRTFLSFSLEVEIKGHLPWKGGGEARKS
ncbi:MAG: DUF1622 domain-containing protein [Alphaproteobacteria bacterium]|nr:DUF1622 domain-containing protein [Alphaproteobacteria bacterium]